MELFFLSSDRYLTSVDPQIWVPELESGSKKWYQIISNFKRSKQPTLASLNFFSLRGSKQTAHVSHCSVDLLA